MENGTKRICWIRVLKNICYFVAPILLATLLLSIISVVYVYETGVTIEEGNYFETSKFADKYLTSIINAIDRVEEVSLEEKDNYTEESMFNDYGYSKRDTIDVNGKNMNVYYNHYYNNFMYLIIDEKNSQVYINGEYGSSYYSTIDSIKEEILSNDSYWVYEKGKINTTINKLNEEKLENTNFYKKNILKGDYVIYTALRKNLTSYDTYVEDYFLYSVVKNQYDYAIYNIPITITLLIIMIPIVLIGIGKTRNQEGIYLNWFDKISIELAVGLLILLGFIGCGICFGIGTNIVAAISIVSIGMGLIILYILLVLLLETVVKRLKTHTFIKTTFAYWLYKKMKLVMNNLNTSLRIGVMFGGFVIANWLIFAIANSDAFIGFVLFMVLYIVSFLYILKRAIWFSEITDAIRKIYEGDTDIRIADSEFKGVLKNVAIHVNDIAGGFSNAVNEKLKSERLKTELITNVSHDIKTPLTSIINYVDLLKKEDITNEKAQEYLTVLDNKSQRLKKLTEDLVEASKASSGNIKLNIEKLNVNELIKQVSGEFEDKFTLRGLEEIITFAEKQVYISADSRYMYRVLENMYSNISKYAMENTRVYTDIIEQGNRIIIQLKNVSKEKLNITADELMQRFVRGDSSRNTEGSGLGLSIATSLTQLQGGDFNIYLDGDLFKITISFEKV